MQLGLGLSQKTSQSQRLSQTQKLSQSQIQSLKVLFLSNADLRNEIYKYAEENPALEITEISQEEVVFDENYQNRNFINESYSYNVGHDAEYSSDEFLSALESNEDYRETLRDHLLFQLNAMKLTNEEKLYCEKLVNNLDKKGFHILSVDSIFKDKTETFKNHCMGIVQKLDPVGVCCSNFQESLLIQAKDISENEEIPEAVLFLLEHFEFLDPPQISKILKKTNDFLTSQRKLKFLNEELPSHFDEDSISEALNFIKTLNPFPASSFFSSDVGIVRPDIFVEKITVSDGEIPFRIRFNDEILPILNVSENFIEAEKQISSISENPQKELSERQKLDYEYSKKSIQNAKQFISIVDFREKTIVRATEEIVKLQLDFFLKGPQFLAPLTQKNLAEILELSDSTISRLANEKYIYCDWGLFPISYFFTNAVNSNSTENGISSKVGVKEEIKKIIEEHKNEKKQLSDQKISDILLQRGVKVARRTVAKYRSELMIEPSHLRG